MKITKEQKKHLMKPFDKLSPKEQEKVLKNGAKMFARDFGETLKRLKNN